MVVIRISTVVPPSTTCRVRGHPEGYDKYNSNDNIIILIIIYVCCRKEQVKTTSVITGYYMTRGRVPIVGVLS